MADIARKNSDLMEITLGDMLDERANRFPDNEAMVYPHEGLRYTYRELQSICNRVARGLIALGIKKGDHVAIWATNVPEWIITMFATAKIGAVLVTVNTNYKKYELEYLLEQSDSMTLILIDGYKGFDYVSCLKEICPELDHCEPGKLNSEALPRLKNVIYAGSRTEAPSGMYHFNDLFTTADSISEAELAEMQASCDVYDVINMQYTSGTTGFPKGVMLTHHNIVNNGNCIGDCMAFTEKDRLCIPVPMFHCFGMVLAVTAAVTHGTTMVVIEHFDALRVMQAVEREKCTALHGVPTMFIAILEHPDFGKFNFSSLRTGIMAGSPCPKEVMRRVIEQMNMREIVITYGQTESSPGITMSRTDDPIDLRVETVGKVLPHCEAKIIDCETGLDCPPNVTGEIVTRGYHAMKGYYNMPEATAQVIDEEGWLHTGDLGSVDEEGYFRVTGRLKDMIIRGGENIYPREIEEYLYTHPMIKDVQIVGVPDRKYGEEILACTILQDDCKLTEKEIIEYVKKGLCYFKRPRYVMFMDEFPMTASGKIQKYKLRQMGIDTLQLGITTAV